MIVNMDPIRKGLFMHHYPCRELELPLVFVSNRYWLNRTRDKQESKDAEVPVLGEDVNSDTISSSHSARTCTYVQVHALAAAGRGR